MNLQFLSYSKKGLKRDKNQDNRLIVKKDNYYLFMIFDGVSSYSDSHIFIREFKKLLKCKINAEGLSEVNLPKLLFETHNDILNYQIKGLTTISLLLIDVLRERAKFVNIGDSRIYVFNKQYIEKVTTDDSLIGRKNIITKCLGLDSLVIEDFKFYDIDFGINYLICTDGFYELMESNLKEYFRVLNFKVLKNIEKRIAFLQRRVNRDDSSFIILKNEI